MVTMSQKSFVPQAAKSVSQALMSDTVELHVESRTPEDRMFYKNLLESVDTKWDRISAGKGLLKTSCQHGRGPDLHYGRT